LGHRLCQTLIESRYNVKYTNFTPQSKELGKNLLGIGLLDQWGQKKQRAINPPDFGTLIAQVTRVHNI
jgi:hypothetical protein